MGKKTKGFHNLKFAWFGVVVSCGGTGSRTGVSAFPNILVYKYDGFEETCQGLILLGRFH